MFRITLSPIAHTEDDAPPRVVGSVMHYQDKSYDLAELPEGAEVEAELPFVSKIGRKNGEIHVELLYKYSSSTSENVQSTNKDDYTFVVEDGQCPDPIIRKEVADEY